MSYNDQWGLLAKKYKKQVVKPLQETMPFLSSDAVIHHSRKLKVFRFTNPEFYNSEDGFPRFGSAETGFIYAVVTDQQYDGVHTSHGERGDLTLNLVYLPNHPKHETEVYLNPADSSNHEYSGFADVVEYAGELYSVDKHWKLDAGVGEKDQFICRASLVKYNHDYSLDDDVETFGHYE